MARNNELIRVAKKAADAWRNIDAYHQAAQIIDMLVEELESDTLTPPNEWVSVEERLPPPNVRVLTYRPDEDDNSPYKYTNMWGWAVKESIRHKGVTHWMYHPAPPDKGNNVPIKAPNEPLTLEELRAIVEPTPIWWTWLQGWVLAKNGMILSWNEGYRNCGGVRGDFYRHPPEGGNDVS